MEKVPSVHPQGKFAFRRLEVEAVFKRGYAVAEMVFRSVAGAGRFVVYTVLQVRADYQAGIDGRGAVIRQFEA